MSAVPSPLHASKSESIDPSIRADVEPLLGRNQSLEMAQALHLRRKFCEKRLPGVPSEAVEPIIALGTDNPHDRIRVPICGGHDRRSRSTQWGTPGRGYRGRR